MIWYKKDNRSGLRTCAVVFFLFLLQNVLYLSMKLSGQVMASFFLVNIAEERLHCCLELSINALDNIGGMISHLDVGFELGIFKHISLPRFLYLYTHGVPWALL